MKSGIKVLQKYSIYRKEDKNQILKCTTKFRNRSKCNQLEILFIRTKCIFWTCLSRLPPTSNSVVSMASAASAQASAVSAVSGVPGFTANQSESLLAGLPHHHPALSPNFLTSPASHQEYLNAAAQRLSEMQAASALDPMNAIEGKKWYWSLKSEKTNAKFLS